MKFPIRLWLFLAVSLLPVLACESEVREANINQNKYIDDYIQQQFSDNQIVRNDGVVRIILTDTLVGAPAIEPGDSAFLYLAGYTFGKGGPGNQFLLDTATVRVGKGDLIVGLDKGLVGAHLGEESILLFPSQFGYGRSTVGMVPENTALMFSFAVAAIKKNK